MVKIDADSATSTPVWLIASALLFMGLRCGLGFVEDLNPPKPSAEINWLSPEQITDADKNGPKFFLYDFTADWCAPCKQMEKTAFQSKDVVNLLNNEFIPVRVVDRKREDGKNSQKVQELQDVYSVQAFPSLVVAMPNGTKVVDHLGKADSQALRKFLQEALTVLPYHRGKEEMIAGETALAAKSFSDFLTLQDWQHWRCVYAAIFGSIAKREIGEAAVADKIVSDAIREVHEHTFPYPILEYLGGKIDFDRLLKAASESKGNRVLCYAYAGLDAHSKKNYKEAIEKFEWVKTNAEDKTTFDYRVSIAWLKRSQDALKQQGLSPR